MFRYNFYESRLNSFKVVVIIPFNTPIHPLITPISGTNTRGILEDFWYVFLCCLNNICWNFQLVTSLFQVSTSFRLIPLDYRSVNTLACTKYHVWSSNTKSGIFQSMHYFLPCIDILHHIMESTQNNFEEKYNLNWVYIITCCILIAFRWDIFCGLSFFKVFGIFIMLHFLITAESYYRFVCTPLR